MGMWTGLFAFAIAAFVGLSTAAIILEKHDVCWEDPRKNSHNFEQIVESFIGNQPDEPH
jgi:hypothetical protein